MSRQKPEQADPSNGTGFPASPGAARRTGSGVAAGLLLGVITIAAYLPAVRCGFIWDDDRYVQNNELLHSVDGLRRIWNEYGATPQYYPLVHTTYWIEYHLWGLNPTGYHVVNILLHVASVVLLWRVLTALQVPGAWVAAAIFAVHPLHVESVAWITERKNVLSGVFYFGAALAYVRYAGVCLTARRPEGSEKLYAAALVLFACALLSKTVTSTLPAALLLVLWWKRKRIGWSDVRALAPFFVGAIVLGLLTIRMEKEHVGAVGKEWELSLVERWLVAGRALWFYAGKLVWPTRLTFIYPRWEIDAGAWQQYLFPAAAIAVMVGLWLVRSRLGRGPLVAVLFFTGTLVPALGFFDVYPMRFSFVADHFTYLASVGLITLAAAVGHRAAARFGQRGKGIGTIVLVFILGMCATLTWHQTHVYKDLETLWRDTLRKNPRAWMAHNNLATVLQGQGKADEAIRHLREALKIKPDHANAHNNLGAALAAQGQFDEAIRHFRQALQFDPRHADARRNLTQALAAQGPSGGVPKHESEAERREPE